MSTKCEQHMCDGSGLRDVGWHLLSPCYCEAGRQIAQQMGAQPETRKPIRIAAPVQQMRREIAARKGATA